MNYLKDIKTNNSSSLDALQNLFKIADMRDLDENLIYNTFLSVYSKLCFFYILKYTHTYTGCLKVHTLNVLLMSVRVKNV